MDHSAKASARGCRSMKTSWSRRWHRIALVATLLTGAGAAAQVAAPSAPPTFCTAVACYDTLDKAEAALRGGNVYHGADALLEHMQTLQTGPVTARMQYWLRKRRYELVRGSAYFANYGAQGTSTGACTLSDDQAALSGWCGDGLQLVSLAESRFQSAWPGCTVTGTTLIQSFDTPGLEPSSSTRGIVNYGVAWYVTSGTCINGANRTAQWSLAKKRPVYCRTGFKPVFTTVDDATLAIDPLCEGQNGDVAYIAAPIQQCASCPGSRHPLYPATGEKRRAESDFAFAGRVFTRHYRSLRQFRNNRSFAVAWTHTWSDRIIDSADPAAPYAHIDEAGNYEAYAPVAGNRYRGLNSADRMLERVNAGGIGWRLRMADGETYEFDLDGYLIAVRDPHAPLQDLSITHVDKSVATVTDAQGRRLRFEYADNLLQRIVLPDGNTVAYAYDANLNLTAATYPGGAMRRYHYNEAGLAGSADQRHHLTGITAEDGKRYASFAYDARGRALSSRVHGTPNEVAGVSYPDEDHATVQTAEGGSDAYTLQPGTYRRVLGLHDGASTATSSYDAEGRLTRTVDRRGVITDYAYTNGYQSAETVAVGTPEERREETDRDPATGLVIERRTRDRNGGLLAQTRWSYNARRQMLSATATDPATGTVRSASIAYCEAEDVAAGTCPVLGLVKRVDGPRSDVADVETYEYRAADAAGCASAPQTCAYRKGDLWKTADALGHVTEILRYDGSGRALSVRDANGVIADVGYDLRGRPAVYTVRGADDTTDTDDQITRIDYHPTGTVRRLLRHDGVQTLFEYDGAQRLTRITDGAGNRIDLTLNAAGEVVREDTRDTAGALLRTLARSYDTLGRVQAQTDAYLKSATFGYDTEDRLTRETDALGRKTDYVYDALGRLTRTLQDVDGLAAQTGIDYDALDRVTRVTDPNGLATTYAYNGFGETLAQTSPDTGTTAYAYDVAGNLHSETDARGVTATYGYDALDRVTSVSYPDSSRNLGFVYDSAQIACPVDERHHIGRLARISDASGGTVYCYDRFGHLTRKLQTTQGRLYALRYDVTPRAGRTGQGTLLRPRAPDGHLYALTYPDGAQVRIERDSLRQPVELTVTLANGQVKTLLRNASYYPFGAVGQWTYGNGRRMQRSSNLNYQPGFVEDSAPGGLNEGYGFDAVGNLEVLRRADQSNPAKRRYVYDGLDRLTQVRDGANDAVLHGYAYDKTGNRQTRTDGAATQTYTYAAGSHRLQSTGGIARQYDAAGNTTRIGGTPAATTSAGAAVGGASALIPTATHSTTPLVGRVSAANRSSLKKKSTPIVGGASAPTRRLMQKTPLPEQRAPHDAVRLRIGRKPQPEIALAAATVRDFVYDDAGRLSQVRHDGVVAMNYLYNAHGERVYKSGGGLAVTTVYDEAGHWLGDYDGNGQPIQQALWLDDLPVGLLVGAGANQRLYYIEPDAMGSPRVVIDPDRDVAVWRWDLSGEAFGDSAPNQDPDGDGSAFVLDLRYPGQRYDSASGLNDNHFRDYDPSTGRYAQSDPIGLDGGVSTYGYANASPMVYNDPEGLIAGLVFRLGMRYALPRLGMRLGANAAARYAQRMALRQAAKRMPRELYRLGHPAKQMEKTFEHALCPQKYVEDVARHYRINLRGSGQKISVVYDGSLGRGTSRLGITYEAEGGRIIRIGPDALADQAATANTIAHELSHARDYLRRFHKPHGTDLSPGGDGSVYGAGNALEEWIKGVR